MEGDENKRMLKEQSTFSHARLCSHRSSLAWHPSGLLCVLLRRNRWFVTGIPTVDARARTDDVWPFDRIFAWSWLDLILIHGYVLLSLDDRHNTLQRVVSRPLDKKVAHASDGQVS